MSFGPDATHSARTAVAVTPSDTTDLEITVRALYVGGSGDVAVLMLGGQTVTFVGVAAGTILPICVTRVLATGTDAGLNILALG
jgi:hypothetical protein